MKENDYGHQSDCTDSFPGSFPCPCSVSGREAGSYLLQCRFDLKENDLVYVTGCYAGQLARVREVITKFKIRPSDYEIVLAKLETDIHGVFRTLDGNYMFSLDSSITPAQFRRSAGIF